MAPRSLAAALLLAAAGSMRAEAHCPIAYQITGPGGLYYQIDLSGSHFAGMLPGGTTSQLGPTTSWTDTRAIAQTTGLAPVDNVFTDGANITTCPTITLNLDGPPRCDQDDDGGVRANHPLCIPSFTIAQTAPGVYSCSAACLPGPFPVPQAYTPPPATAPMLASLSPASLQASPRPFALDVSGAGFTGGSVVQWNGQPLPTTFVDAGSLIALVPAGLAASPGPVSVTVAIPGAVSAAVTLTIHP